jgi:Protein of unknown function (DUF3551)
MIPVRQVLLAAAAVLAALAFNARQAAAYEAPWCAVFSAGLGDTIWDCSYQSLKQCIPFVIAGTRGMCNENPHYTRPRVNRHRYHRVRRP